MSKYDVLKSFGQIIFPALITCVLTILKALNIQNTDVIQIILTSLLTCYNSIIVVWNSNYYKNLADSSNENDKGVGEQG